MTDNSWAAKYIGLKYEKLGRGPMAFDCWGIVMLVYKNEFGVTLPDFRYPPDLTGYLAEVRDKKTMFREIPEHTKKTGDIVLMKIKTAPIHVGVFCEPGHILHGMNAESGIVFDRIGQWQNQIEGFYRWAC